MTPAETSPSRVERWVIHTGSWSLVLASFAVTWSAFPNLLTWRHSQLIAAAVTGMWLILLRIFAPNPAGVAAGRAPLAIAMTALMGTVAVALPVSHPELWSAASLVMMLTGITTWLWYPPVGLDPFRIARRASIALALSVLIALLLEALGISPLRINPILIDTARPLSGPFDRSETLSTSLVAITIALTVGLWTAPSAARRFRAIGSVVLVALVSANALFAQPLSPLFALSLAIATTLGTGAAMWAERSRGAGPLTSRARAWRLWTALVLSGMLLGSLITPPFAPASPTLQPRLETHSPLFQELDPMWQSSDPLVPELKDQLDTLEWRGVLRNLPFGSGAGTWLDENVSTATRQLVLPEYDAPTRIAGWPDQPRSVLAAAIIEWGIIAAFAWILIAIGGVLIARLVIRTRTFAPELALLSGAAPVIILGFLPGGSHPVVCFALLLNWFLLCAPLADSDSEEGKKMVPRESTAADPRRAPRGRILIILIPAFFVGWFSIQHTRWTRQSGLAYAAAARGEIEVAHDRFARANQFLAHPATLYNEAKLFEMLYPNERFEHLHERYSEALRRRPHAADYFVARAEVALREHQHVLETHGMSAAQALTPTLQKAASDLRRAIRYAPKWGAPRERLAETLLLLGERDDALQTVRDAEEALSDPREIAAIKLHEVRIAIYLDQDAARARDLLEAAESGPIKGAMLALIGIDRGRVDFWLRTGENPFTDNLLHEGHHH